MVDSHDDRTGAGGTPQLDVVAARTLRRNDPATLISIIVPFYNEEEAISAFFQEINRVTSTMQCEVEYICVNDGSHDHTLELLQEKLASDPRVLIVDLTRNFGKEAAVTAGLAYAHGKAAVVIDADLQDPPSVIPALVTKWREGYDVVYGIRSSRKADNFLKRCTANGFYALFNKLTDVRIPTGASDFRLLDRRAIDALLSLPERNRFMKGLFSWIGFHQTGVEFERGVRVAGSTTWSYLRLCNFAIDAVTSFSIKPLRVASLAGIFVSLIGFCYAAFLTTRTIVFGVDVPGYASVMVIVMFLGGVQLMGLGLIGEYLGRLYVEAKGRPLYLVSDVYASSDVTDLAKYRMPLDNVGRPAGSIRVACSPLPNTTVTRAGAEE